jgi:hypothetical protein
MIRSKFRFIGLALLVGVVFLGCHDDEGDQTPTPPQRDVISLTYENPLVIEIDAVRQWALLLHDSSASSGTALQLVDLATRSVIATRILDYYNVYDIKFLSASSACFAGRPHGNIGYAVQFVHLPDLRLDTMVLVTDVVGTHGYLAVDTAGGYVYYSHAGGDSLDGVYRIRISTKAIVDADNDGHAPYGFDNGLVSGLFDRPARIFYDAPSGKIVVANLGADYVTMVDVSIWGTLQRSAGLVFPVNGTAHLSTTSGSVNNVRAEAMGTGAGVYVFAGKSGNTAYLSRFSTNSVGLDFIETATDRQWTNRNAALCVHPRQDIFSVFVLQHDEDGGGIGQYRLNNLLSVTGSPYHTLAIPDTSLCAVGIDTLNDRLIVGDANRARLELISIQ